MRIIDVVHRSLWFRMYALARAGATALAVCGLLLPAGDAHAPREGFTVGLHIRRSATVQVTRQPEVDPGASLALGQVRVRIPTGRSRIHLFQGESGAALTPGPAQSERTDTVDAETAIVRQVYAQRPTLEDVVYVQVVFQ